MIFPVLQYETMVQVDDKLRLDASASYKSPDENAISLIEIQPSASDGFYDVTENGYLDWQYATDGAKSVVVKITTDSTPVTKSYSLTAISEVDDYLFSSDQELIAHDPQIIKYLPDGKSSWKFYHRRCQQYIVDEIQRRGYRDQDGNAYSKSGLLNKTEVREWATYSCLALIYNGLSNAVDDVFDRKAKAAEEEASKMSKMLYLTLDVDGDEIADDFEKQSQFDSIRIQRR